MHVAKSAGGRLQLNTHVSSVCGFALSDTVRGCMVYTERAETAAVSCGTSHASAVKYSTLVDIQKRAIKSYSICERSESARERRIALHKSDHHHHRHHHHHHHHHHRRRRRHHRRRHHHHHHHHHHPFGCTTTLQVVHPS